MLYSIPVIRPFGVDIFCLGKKFLVYNMVSRNLKIKYRRSILGVFWTLVSPVAMTMVYYFVFKVILKIQIPHYLVFILSGVLPWAFFGQTLGEGMESIVGSWGLLSKVPVPAQVFPYVGALTNLSTLLIATPVMVGAAFISRVPLGPSLAVLPYFLFTLFFITYFLSLVMGILFVYFRDLRHILGILLQLWFYATPVLYDESMIPEKYHWVLYLNPVGHIFTGIHKVLVHGVWPTQTEVLSAGIWMLVIFLIASIFFRIFGKELVERI